MAAGDLSRGGGEGTTTTDQLLKLSQTMKTKIKIITTYKMYTPAAIYFVHVIHIRFIT